MTTDNNTIRKLKTSTLQSRSLTWNSRRNYSSRCRISFYN